MKTIKKLSAGYAVLILIQIVVLTIVTGCSKSSDNTPGPGTNEVLIQSFAFSPVTLTVPVNTTVTWTNNDAAAHNVTSSTGLFSSGTMPNGATYSHQFTSTGTFPYSCTIHPTMTAVIIVQ